LQRRATDRSPGPNKVAIAESLSAEGTPDGNEGEGEDRGAYQQVVNDCDRVVAVDALIDERLRHVSRDATFWDTGDSLGDANVEAMKDAPMKRRERVGQGHRGPPMLDWLVRSPDYRAVTECYSDRIRIVKR